MNDELQAVRTSRETPVSNLSRTSSEHGTKHGCCNLFLRCFKGRRRKASIEDIVDNDNGKEFDYVVEKLVLQRVPFVLISIQGNPSARQNDPTSESSTSSKEVNSAVEISDPSIEASDRWKSLRKVKHAYLTASETQSLLYYPDRVNQNMIRLDTPNKCSPSDTEAVVSNEGNNKDTLPDDYHSRLTELMNAMSCFHPDLKEHERPPKDPCPLNMKRNRSSSTKISIKRFLNKDHEDQQSKALKSQTSLQESFFRKKALGIINSSESKSKHEQKVFHLNGMHDMPLGNRQGSYASESEEPVEDISCNSKDPVISVIDTNENLSFTNESKRLSENKTNTNLSSTTLKWKIIVKHYKAETLGCPEASQEIRKYFSTS